jgi:hypothetical protein
MFLSDKRSSLLRQGSNEKQGPSSRSRSNKCFFSFRVEIELATPLIIVVIIDTCLPSFFAFDTARGQCYKTFYGHKLRLFIIS